MKLTKKQQKIAEMIAEGYDNDIIIEKLGIKVSTLKTHLNNIYKRLNIKKNTHTNCCRSLVVAKMLKDKIEMANEQLKKAEILHKESLMFMRPEINICRKFMEIYQNRSACKDCPEEMVNAKCERKKNICLKQRWELLK